MKKLFMVHFLSEILKGCRGIARLTAPGGQESNISSFFFSFSCILSHSSSVFHFFSPQLGPQGGQPAHPGRPWLHTTERVPFCDLADGQKQVWGVFEKKNCHTITVMLLSSIYGFLHLYFCSNP